MMLKACIKKEFLESLREHKLIIILMGFIFFSLATPPLLKLTPKLLEEQYGEEISSLMNFTAINSVENYIGSTFSQICILILALAIGGVLSNELNTKSIVIPFTKGIGKSTLALAKIIYYSIVVSIITMLSTVLNIVYSYVVFKEDIPEINLILFEGFKVSIYALLIMSLVFTFSSIFNKAVIASLAAMVINIVLSLINTFEYKWNPYNLIGTSSILKDKDVSVCLYISIVLIIVFLSLTVRIFKNRSIYN